MSWNLYVKENGGKELSLLQTPSYITQLCLSYNAKGKPDGGPEGVRNRYILWVKHLTQEQFNQACNDPEEQKRVSGFAKEHIEQVKALKNPRFYML